MFCLHHVVSCFFGLFLVSHVLGLQISSRRTVDKVHSIRGGWRIGLLLLALCALVKFQPSISIIQEITVLKVEEVGIGELSETLVIDSVALLLGSCHLKGRGFLVEIGNVLGDIEAILAGAMIARHGTGEVGM